MGGNKFLEWFFRLLFPLVLIGVILYSIAVQPPLISSPEVKVGFAQHGSRLGYFEYLAPKFEPWPGNLHPLLAKALVRSYGRTRPLVQSFYYFGTARQEVWGLRSPVGYESLLKPGRGFSRQTGLSAFNLYLSLWQTGMLEGRVWSRKNGDPKPAEPDKARAAFLLEQAVLLLPLVQEGPAFSDDGPGRIKALAGPGLELGLEFSGEVLTRATAGGYEIRPDKWAAFGEYTLPARLSGRWGQVGLSALEIKGLVLNPPFAREALTSAAR